MKLLPIILAMACSGCQVYRYNRPPEWASVVSQKCRFFGLNLAYQGVGVQLGWGSTTFTVLPVSTNVVYIPRFSDTFSTSQAINPFDTRIREYLYSGYEDLPPPAMMINTNSMPNE